MATKPDLYKILLRAFPDCKVPFQREPQLHVAKLAEKLGVSKAFIHQCLWKNLLPAGRIIQVLDLSDKVDIDDLRPFLKSY